MINTWIWSEICKTTGMQRIMYLHLDLKERKKWGPDYFVLFKWWSYEKYDKETYVGLGKLLINDWNEKNLQGWIQKKLSCIYIQLEDHWIGRRFCIVWTNSYLKWQPKEVKQKFIALFYQYEYNYLLVCNRVSNSTWLEDVSVIVGQSVMA